MPNPLTFSIPRGKKINFSVTKDAALAQKANIKINLVTKGGGILAEEFEMIYESTIPSPRTFGPYEFLAIIVVEGYYSYKAQYYKSSGKMCEQHNNTRFVVGFDDNQGHSDYNDLIVTVTTTDSVIR